MTEKHTDNSKYKHSHPKNAKSEAKYLTRSSVPDTIFSNKQQATSNKQQATSNKQQATSGQSGISAQSAQCTQNTHKFLQLITRTGQKHCLRAFFTLHRLRKPQRPQRTQRIIKECLTKPLLKHLASLACSAVKLKNIRRTRC
ncbi:hypothetical protein HMPREF9727_02107 [Treponema denticola MYR-T]|uniref:Uncharacterized protein n=1 Tax=Treponema denticola H1-T TaxID=999431 RepID=M2BF82_TREDN|nr:hypothetical protein HMPREF9727_02107 [Treponema denticola MYR-T]EMB28030.1 hypothetical protein HMPREF9725_02460 [Treponema denticola H1-T]